MKKHISLSLCLVVILMFSTFMNMAFAAETGKSVSTGFSGTLNSDWNLAGTSGKVKDGLLKVKGGEFALKVAGGTYDNWAATFDIAYLKENSAWAGIAFGLKTPDSNFYDSGSHLIYFGPTEVVLFGAPKLEFAQILEDKEYRFLPEEIQLKNLKEPMNVKITFSKGQLNVYFKTKSQPASELDKPKATYSKLGDIQGYMMLTTSGEADFAIDNLNIYNDPNKMTASAGSKPKLTGTKAVAAGAGQIKVNFNKIAGKPSVYQIQWWFSKDKKGNPIYQKPITIKSSVVKNNSYSYTFKGLKGGTTYHFNVSALDGHNKVLAVTMDLTAKAPK